MAVTTPDVCRVTVVTPNRWADLVLPAGEPLAALLPALLDHVGDADLEGRPLALQRLGGPPLDDDRSLSGNGVVDGETLYLNAAEEALPELEFDDAIAGLGEGIEGLANRWRPLYTRRLLLGVAPLPAAVSLAVLVAQRPNPHGAAVVAAGAALLLTAGAALASRAWNDRTLALLLGAAALPFAAAAGGLSVVGLGASTVVSPATGLAAAVALFCVATAADFSVGGLSVGFAGAAFAAALAALGCGLGLFVGWTAADTAALVLVLAVISAEVAVGIACRLAGVFLPPLPRTAEELEEGIEPVPAQEVLTRAAQVDQYLTALLWGASALIVPCSVVLTGRGAWSSLLVAVASTASLLRLRVFFGAGQRAALLVAGVAGPSSMLLQAGLFGRGTLPLWIALGGVALTVVVVTGAVMLPGRRTLPHLGRSAELLEGVVAAALVPVLLAVLGTYEAARNIR